MSLPSEDLVAGWQPPHRGLIQGGYPLRPPFSSVNSFPNWREAPIHCHPVCEAEVQEGKCRKLPRWGGWGRGGHCCTDPSHYYALQGGCEGVESGILQT